MSGLAALRLREVLGLPFVITFHALGRVRRAFQRDVIGPLEASDSARRSEFIRTLEAFLKAGGNHMRAARDLHVHRNTLIERR